MACSCSTTDTIVAGDKLRLWKTSMGDWRDAAFTVLVEFLSSAFTSLTASSFLKVTACTVAQLPDPATAGAGARATVTDATATTFASIVAGGGANTVPVYSDGSDWRIG